MRRISHQWAGGKIHGLDIGLASVTNHHLSLWVSLFLHPDAVGCNCLAIDWNDFESIYAFPLVGLIPSMLPLIRGYRGCLVLVAPWGGTPRRHGCHSSCSTPATTFTYGRYPISFAEPAKSSTGWGPPPDGLPSFSPAGPSSLSSSRNCWYPPRDVS